MLQLCLYTLQLFLTVLGIAAVVSILPPPQ